jgi:hypothetical protein
MKADYSRSMECLSRVQSLPATLLRCKTELEDRTMFTKETKLGRTPNGGIYRTAFYKDDKGNLADKSVATRVEIVEYDQDGKEIHRTYGPIQSADGV